MARHDPAPRNARRDGVENVPLGQGSSAECVLHFASRERRLCECSAFVAHQSGGLSPGASDLTVSTASPARSWQRSGVSNDPRRAWYRTHRDSSHRLPILGPGLPTWAPPGTTTTANYRSAELVVRRSVAGMPRGGNTCNAGPGGSQSRSGLSGRDAVMALPRLRPSRHSECRPGPSRQAARHRRRASSANATARRLETHHQRT